MISHVATVKGKKLFARTASENHVCTFFFSFVEWFRISNFYVKMNEFCNL